jgi:branched-chain amino acid transport system substrate-binding protein
MKHQLRASFVVVATLAVSLIGAGCTTSSYGPADTSDSEIVIGFILPQTGPYKAIGDDQLRGWNLYLDSHAGKLGGHTVKVVIADEGPGGSMARTSVDKLIKQDKASIIVGTTDAQAASAVAPVANTAQVPYIGMGGRPSTLDDIAFVWHTTFQSTDYGHAGGASVAKTVHGPVYVIGLDNQGGRDQLGGFVESFAHAGGHVANDGGRPTYTPVTATDFGPWLAQIKDTGAVAVYAFYAGPSAVAFVKQYQAFGLKPIPLYGPAFLTEGPVLVAQAGAADDVYTVANYAPGLQNTSNLAMAKQVSDRYQSTPTVYHVTAYDAAAVLDHAIADAGPLPTPQAINAAIGRLPAIDSPRGSWSFNAATHTPVQQWFLRQVQTVQGVRTNVIVSDLGSS